MIAPYPGGSFAIAYQRGERRVDHCCWRSLAHRRALCHGFEMLKPDPRAGGCFLSLLILAGFVVGLSLGDPVAGALIGTASGMVVALLVWLADRKGRRADR